MGEVWTTCATICSVEVDLGVSWGMADSSCEGNFGIFGMLAMVPFLFTLSGHE